MWASTNTNKVPAISDTTMVVAFVAVVALVVLAFVAVVAFVVLVFVAVIALVHFFYVHYVEDH